MGDRVAVIKKGRLQQVDEPQVLYDHPANLFVAGFIGSPAMNMVEAELQRDGQTAAGRVRRRHASRSTPRSSPRARRSRSFEGKPVIVGIRPEDIEDAAIHERLAGRSAHPHDGRRCARRSAPRCSCTSPSTAPGAHRRHARAGARRRRRRARRRPARGPVDVRRSARALAPRPANAADIELVVDTEPHALLRPRNGFEHRGGRMSRASREGGPMTRRRRWFVARSCRSRPSRCSLTACSGGEDLDDDGGGTETSGGAGAVDLSGETVEVAATWTGAEQERFQMVLDAFARADGRHRAVPLGRRRRRGLRRDRASRAATRPTWRSSRSQGWCRASRSRAT